MRPSAEVEKGRLVLSFIVWVFIWRGSLLCGCLPSCRNKASTGDSDSCIPSARYRRADVEDWPFWKSADCGLGTSLLNRRRDFHLPKGDVPRPASHCRLLRSLAGYFAYCHVHLRRRAGLANGTTPLEGVGKAPISVVKGASMRITIDLDDELVRRAKEFTGISNIEALIREALTRLAQREAARRLAALGGSDPDADAAPRRRDDGRSI